MPHDSPPPSDTPPGTQANYSLGDLVRYALRLGTFGCGGPVALVGFMHRDLVERRRWISEAEYKEGLTLAQIMPGPLAARFVVADPSPVFVPVLMRELGISPRGVSEGGA